MSVHLPPEVLTQILTKLPVKYIVRSRCVCKTWYSLISSPDFISDHTAQTLNRSSGDRVLVHRCTTPNQLSDFSFHDKAFVESHEHPDVPEQLRCLMNQIIGSCDGLICFCKHEAVPDRTVGMVQTFLIWNPSIRKLVEPPSRPAQPSFTHFGFGFDSESRDYKVVKIVDPEPHGSSDEFVAEIDIFDLRKGVWRSLSSPVRRPCSLRWPCVYLHGNLHWVGNDETSPNCNYVIVSFNLSREVLVLHGMEMVLGGRYTSSCPRLFSINGLLSVAIWKEIRQGDARRGVCSVWSMKEYGVTESWTKLFTIEMPPSARKLLRFWENGELLFVELVGNYKDVSSVLALYNPESGKSTPLFSANGKIMDACFYKESLILL